MADVISKQAKRKACELANEFCDGSWSVDEFNNPHNPSFMGAAALRALARVLQEHSDVAKGVASSVGYMDRSQIAENLRSIILPDEPCPHETVFRYPPCKTFTCTKCGKALKIVECGR